MRLGKVTVLVTGASAAGIGQVVASHLRREGARLLNQKSQPFTIDQLLSNVGAGWAVGFVIAVTTVRTPPRWLSGFSGQQPSIGSVAQRDRDRAVEQPCGYVRPSATMPASVARTIPASGRKARTATRASLWPDNGRRRRR